MQNEANEDSKKCSELLLYSLPSSFHLLITCNLKQHSELFFPLPSPQTHPRRCREHTEGTRRETQGKSKSIPVLRDLKKQAGAEMQRVLKSALPCWAQRRSSVGTALTRCGRRARTRCCTWCHPCHKLDSGLSYSAQMFVHLRWFVVGTWCSQPGKIGTNSSRGALTMQEKLIQNLSCSVSQPQMLL